MRSYQSPALPLHPARSAASARSQSEFTQTCLILCWPHRTCLSSNRRSLLRLCFECNASGSRSLFMFFSCRVELKRARALSLSLSSQLSLSSICTRLCWQSGVLSGRRKTASLRRRLRLRLRQQLLSGLRWPDSTRGLARAGVLGRLSGTRSDKRSLRRKSADLRTALYRDNATS